MTGINIGINDGFHADIRTVWSTLGGDPALTSHVATVVRRDVLHARLPVRELARICVAACALVAAELGARRAGAAEVPSVRVDDGAVATAFTSERHLRVEGRAPVTFAPLSRFWRTADGWVRTHANYPHHRARLLAALGVPDHLDTVEVDDVDDLDDLDDVVASDAVGRVAVVLAERTSADVEDAVYAAGGLAVALRTPAQWAAHTQGAEVARRPLVERGRLDAAPARTRTGVEPGAVALPAAGVRVLDLTRVIAGPVATRTLALLGADVLRVDGVSPR